MPGLFDVRLRDAAVSCGKSGVVRRVRHGDSEITIDTDHEVGLVLNLSESLAITRRLDGRTSSARPKVGAVTLMPPGRPTAFRLVGAARVLMLRVPWRAGRADITTPWCSTSGRRSGSERGGASLAGTSRQGIRPSAHADAVDDAPIVDARLAQPRHHMPPVGRTRSSRRNTGHIDRLCGFPT